MTSYTPVAEGAPKEDPGLQLARAKLLLFLEKREAGSVTAQQNVYGASIAMPQIARSMQWPGMMTRNVVRGYFFLLLNIFVQMSLLYFVSMESEVVSPLGGQMHLCNFGANMVNCPDGAGCTGPSGTQYTPSRLYSYGAIADRTFVKQALLDVLPEKVSEINKLVDVGEYGVESPSCRLLCVFLFMVAMVVELFSLYDMILLIHSTPTNTESWVTYEVPTFATKERVKEIRGCSELDLITVKVAGIPWIWKVINVIFVLLPKFLIFKVLCEVGVSFLMETAAMVDLVVNSCALGFVMSIDEVFFQTFTKDSTRYMMERLEAFALFDTTTEEDMPDAELHIEHDKHHKASWDWHKLMEFLPMRFLCALALTAWFIYDYYCKNCMPDDDGTMVSKPMYIPKQFKLSVLRMMLPRFFPADVESTPFWTPPPEESAGSSQ